MLNNQPRTPFPNRVGNHLRRTLIAGLLALIPLAFTIFILLWLFNAIDDFVQPLVERIFDREIIGVGFGITIIAFYFVGLLVANLLGRRLVTWVESWLLRVPIARWFYNIFRQIIDVVSSAGHARFKVVLIQWPKEGTYTIGFQTSTMETADGKRYCSVLIPTTPTPQSGLLAIVPEEEVIHTNLSVDEGVKLIVSSGVLAPKDLMDAMDRAKREGEAARPG